MITLYKQIFKRTDWLKAYERAGRRHALNAFSRAYKTQRWYRDFCKHRGITTNTIKNIDDWSNVPILDKEIVFQNHSLRQLLGNQETKTHLIFPSSGRSGRLSYGVMGAGEVKRAMNTTDHYLRLFFGFKKNDTLIINCSAMAVRVFTRFTCCDVGSRPDLVAGMLKNLSNRYKQVVITTYPHFIKHLVEYCLEAGIDFKAINIFFITGGDYFPESLRSYIHSITEKSFLKPEKGYWLGTYGLTEIGYPLFFETPDTARLRQCCQSGQINEDDLGYSHPYRVAKPFYFNYIPLQCYVENSNDGQNNQLLLTHLVKKKIRLIRYTPGDSGVLYDQAAQKRLFQLLQDQNIQRDYRFMILSLFGKNDDCLTVAEQKTYVNDIRELLFQNHAVAASVTGYFTLKKQQERLRLAIQLKRNQKPNSSLADILKKKLTACYGDLIDVECIPFYTMTHQMGIDFERKFNHLPG